MIPPNWHIIDDESIMALMAEALRDASPEARPTQTVSSSMSVTVSGKASDALETPPALPPVGPDATKWLRVRMPAHAASVLVSALLTLTYVSIPVLFFVFDAAVWSAFADVCNLIFAHGSGDVWAMQWIGWSQRHPAGLIGVCLLWIACGGVIMLFLKRKNPGLLLKEMMDRIRKKGHDMRLALPRGVSKTSQAGER